MAVVFNLGSFEKGRLLLLLLLSSLLLLLIYLRPTRETIFGWKYQLLLLVCRKNRKIASAARERNKRKRKKKKRRRKKKKKKKKEEEEHATIPEIFRETHPAMLAPKYFQVCEPRFLSGNFNVNGLLL